MTIFDKFQPLAEARRELEQSASQFFNVVMEDIISGTEAVVDGRRQGEWKCLLGKKGPGCMIFSVNQGRSSNRERIFLDHGHGIRQRRDARIVFDVIFLA